MHDVMMMRKRKTSKTLKTGNQKEDFIPPFAPKKGANNLPVDGDGINATLGAAIEKEHEDRMQTCRNC